MQQLNSRLASYLQQVKHLEEANHRLECQIQRELDRKCPRELRELDRHLRTASLLQDQISDCLSAQAQVKLQLLNAELTVFDLNVRCEKEHERRTCLEEELSNLRLLGEELQVHRLPELQGLLNEQTQELMGLQIQHEQERQGLLAQMSHGVSVEMQPAGTLDLIQQLNDLRQTNVAVLTNNQNECWFNNQVSMLSTPEVTFDPQSEILQAELTELRRLALSLEEELMQLQALNEMLEASGLEQNDSFIEQLVVLQQTADFLCMELDSVLQSAAQQATDHQTLLDVKTRLETEIQDYRRLLDGLNPQSPSAFRRNITVNRAVSVHGGNLRMMEVQALSRGHVRPLGHTSFPLSATVTTVESIGVQGRHPDYSPVTSMNTSSTRGSFHKSANLITGSLPETTRRESIAVSRTINRHTSPVEDKVHTEACDWQNSSVVSPQISRSFDKGGAVGASITETSLVRDTQFIRSPAFEAKTETTASKQSSTAAGPQVNIQTEVKERLVLGTGPEVKTQGRAPVAPAVRDTVDITVTESTFSRSHTLRSEEDQGKVSGNLTVMDDKDRVTRLDQSSVLSQVSKSEQNKVMENSELATTSSVSQESSDLHLQGKTTQVMSAAVQAPPGTVTSKLTTTQFDLHGNKRETTTVMTKTTFGAEPEVKHGQHIVTHTTRTDPSKETAAEVKTETETVTEGSDLTGNQDPAQIAEEVTTITTSVVSGSHVVVADREQNKVTEDGDRVSQTTTEADLQANKTETHVQTLITETILCAGPEVKRGPPSTITEASKEAAAEVTETETEISTQINCTEGSVQDKNQDPAKTVSLCLETPAEAAKDGEEVPITASVASGAHVVGSEEALGTVSGNLTLMHEQGVQRQTKKEEVEGTSPPVDQRSTSDTSNQQQNKVTEDGDRVSQTTTEADLQANKTEVTETETKNQDPAQAVSLSLETPAEAARDAEEVPITASVASGSHVLMSEEAQVQVSGDFTLTDGKDPERHEKKEKEGADGTDASNNEQNKVIEAGDTGSGIATALSSSPDNNESKTESTEKVELEENKGTVVNGFYDTNEVMVDSTQLDNEKVNPEGQTPELGTAESKPSTCQTGSVALNSSNTEELLHPEEGQLLVNPPEPVTCLSTAGPEVSLSPNEEGEDEEEARLTEASVLVRPVEKYILSTREEPLSTDQAFAKCDRTGKVHVSVETGDRLCFGSSEADKVSRGALNGTINLKPKSHPLGGMTTSMASDVAASVVGLAAHSSGLVRSKAEATSPAGVPGTIRRNSGEFRVYGGRLGQTNMVSKENLAGATVQATSQQETGRFSRKRNGEWKEGPGLPGEGKDGSPSATMDPQERGRFGSGGNGDWIVYSGSLGRKRSLSRTRSEESPSVATLPATSLPEMRTYGIAERNEWMVSGGIVNHSSGLVSNNSLRGNLPTSPPGSGRPGSRGSGEWRVYGGSSGRMSSWAGSKSLSSVDKDEIASVAPQQVTSPPGSLGTGRFGGSGEWRVYGGSSGPLSNASSGDKTSERISSSSQSRLNSAGSGGRLSSGALVRRSSSVGSGGNLGSTGSGGRLSSSSRSQRTSLSSGRFTSTGSGEWKPVYSSNSGRRSSAGSTGRSSAGGAVSNQRSGNCPVSGSKLSTGSGSDRVGNRPGGRISSSSGSGRTNSTGGRVISSSDRPIRSTGSGAGGNKERISVCKMAALSISAAGRERSLDRERQAQRLQQQQAAATSPFLQRWLTSGLDVKSADPEGPDDIMHL